MDNSVYDKMLMGKFGVIAVILLALLVLLVGAIIYLIRNRADYKDGEDKFVFFTLLVLAVGAIIGDGIFMKVTLSDVVYDIKNQAYIVSEGTFTVFEDRKTPSKQSSIRLPDGTRLEIHAMQDGEYTGRVVYGERTEMILDMDLKKLSF